MNKYTITIEHDGESLSRKIIADDIYDVAWYDKVTDMIETLHASNDI